MASKTWRYLALGYLVFYFVAIVIERHGIERAPMSPLERILTAPILLGFVVYGLQRGSLAGRFSSVDRSENPITFWTLVTLGFMYGVFLFCWGMADSFR